MNNFDEKNKNITLSAGQDLLINIDQVGQFQVLIVTNNILSGCCHVYQDDTHIADILFKKCNELISPKMTVKSTLVSASGDGEEINVTAAWY